MVWTFPLQKGGIVYYIYCTRQVNSRKSFRVFQEREEKEAAERLKLETARKEREAAKKLLKKERKALRTICKDAQFSSKNEDERVRPVIEHASRILS